MGVRTALRDVSSLIPPSRALAFEVRGCGNPGVLVPRFREAGVAYVLSVDPLADPALRLRGLRRPPGLAPLPLFVYSVEGTRPRWSLEPYGGPEPGEGGIREVRERPGAFDFQVEAAQPAVLVVRESFSPGWRATVNGRDVPVVRAYDHYQSVAVPAGRSTVHLRYRPRHLGAAAAVSVASALVLAATLRRRRLALPTS